MERAARAMCLKLQQVLGECRCSVSIVCGFGNNGGDGLALARMLHEAGHELSIYLIDHASYSADNLLNQQRLAERNIAVTLIDKASALSFSENSIIVDALFGYGLSRPLDSSWSALLHQINSASNSVYAVDIPSGLLADQPSPPEAPIVCANVTYTFVSPKLTLLLPDNAHYAGDFCILDINLLAPEREGADEGHYYSTLHDAQRRIQALQKFAHKGSFGHACIAGGRHGSIGAVVLASMAALRTGCGLVSGYVPRCGVDILQSAFPEALTLADEADRWIESFPTNLSAYAALAVGMGMGKAESTQIALKNLLERLLEDKKVPRLVLDADALNILGLHKEWHGLIPPHSILTPHPKELQRLLGSWENDFEKLSMTRNWCIEHQQIVVIKGAHSAVVLPCGDIHFNSTGNPGMATGGSGDVLSGILASLLAQGYLPEDAAIVGVYLHGLAADCAATSIHQKSLIASDIVAHLSDAWQRLMPLTKIGI